MGKNDVLRHRFDKSLNVGVGISGRTGDVEDGSELIDLLTSHEVNGEDSLIERENRAARVRFLKQFFAILKQILTEEEFKFVKLRFTQKKRDKQIAVWLGFNNAADVFRSIGRKMQREERTINRIVERSDWDGAQVFVTAITTGTAQLMKDEELRNNATAKNAGFHALMEASKVVSRVKKEKERAKIKRRFYMRGIYHGAKMANDISYIQRALRTALYSICGGLDAIADIIDKRRIEEQTQKSEDEDLYAFIRRMREHVFKLFDKYLSLFDKEQFFQKMAQALVNESMNERKTYSQRCAEKRMRDSAEG